jgi:hypothetical protein
MLESKQITIVTNRLLHYLAKQKYVDRFILATWYTQLT